MVSNLQYLFLSLNQMIDKHYYQSEVQSMKLQQYPNLKIEMEKVPNLDIFSQRQLKKSNSLSRINHHDSSYRPSSTFQSQKNPNTKSKNYYDQAIKILNVDSQINYNLRNIENKQQESFNRGNLKKITKNQQFERPHATFANPPQVTFQPPPPSIIHAPQTVKINYSHPPFHGNLENIHPPQVFFPQQAANYINQAIPHVIIKQQQPDMPRYGQQNNFIIPPNQQHMIVNNCPTQSHLQRAASAQNLHFHDYSQPDRILSSCRIDPVCNNEQQQKVKNNLRQSNSKGEQYTFRNQGQAQSKAGLKLRAPITLNPFLFDATYLLQVKQSQSRLPDLSLATNSKQYFQEIQKKKDLIQQLIEIKQANQIEGHNILRQLDSLIEQFGNKIDLKTHLEESEFKNSRRSLFGRSN